MTLRGEIWWANLPAPTDSGPGYRRPVLIVQADDFNQSLIRTTIVAILTSNLRLATAGGNVVLPMEETGLSKPSVVNVSQIFTLDKSRLVERVSAVSPRTMTHVDTGLEIVLGLQFA